MDFNDLIREFSRFRLAQTVAFERSKCHTGPPAFLAFLSEQKYTHGDQNIVSSDCGNRPIQDLF